MNYIDKTTGNVISKEVYDQLNPSVKSKYVLNSTSRTSVNDNSGDFLTSVAIGAVTDSALLGGVLGGDMIGGILGDMMDGDLMD